MDELVLEACEKKIKMIIHNRAWCQMYLLENDNAIILGENSLEIIISKLLNSFVPEKKRKYFIYNNEKLFTVVNLMGSHAVIAAKESEDFGIELIFLSNEGNMIPMVTLYREDIKEWINKLIKFIVSYM